MKRIVITGGGTGGHLYPALAVAEALKEDVSVEDILYIGNIKRREAELVPQYGIRFEGIQFSGMPRGINLQIAAWGKDLGMSFLKARKLLKEFKADIAFGTGGYVTAPVLLAARSLGIPIVVHEPDAYPGLVNRVLAPWSTAVTCAFGESQQRLKTKHLHVTGNPLRSQIGQVSKEQALENLAFPFTLDKPILLVTGGSQGARKINQGVLEALPTLIEELHYQVIHQTGDKLFEETLAQCPEAYRNHPGYFVAPFIQDMASTLALADVAICRSGSMTLSEMYRGHIPTILVPYPYAAADHQRQNALASQAAGASLMIEDAAFNGQTLIETLQKLRNEPHTQAAMKQAAQQLSAPSATADIIALLKAVVS